jgi:hypothetical protein
MTNTKNKVEAFRIVKISNVSKSNFHIVHMQAITTHFAIPTNFAKVEVMQLATIQVQDQSLGAT